MLKHFYLIILSVLGMHSAFYSECAFPVILAAVEAVLVSSSRNAFRFAVVAALVS